MGEVISQTSKPGEGGSWWFNMLHMRLREIKEKSN